jgi:hypothetical protein
MMGLFVAPVACALRRPRLANLVRAIVRRAHTAAASPVWRKSPRAPAKALATLVSVLRIAIPRRTCARPRRQTAPPAILIRNAPVAIAWVIIAASGRSRRRALVPAWQHSTEGLAWLGSSTVQAGTGDAFTGPDGVTSRRDVVIAG